MSSSKILVNCPTVNPECMNRSITLLGKCRRLWGISYLCMKYGLKAIGCGKLVKRMKSRALLFI